MFPQLASWWRDDLRTYQGVTYSARFENGSLRDIGPLGKPCISEMIYSSAETGWTDEPGTAEKFEVVRNGPVRTIVHVRKALHAGITIDKTFTFYHGQFEVSGRVIRPGGVVSRS